MLLSPKWKVFNLFCSLLLALAVLGMFLNLSFPVPGCTAAPRGDCREWELIWGRG